VKRRFKRANEFKGENNKREEIGRKEKAPILNCDWNRI